MARSLPDTFYARLPLRRITGRVTYYSPELPPFPAGYFVEPYLLLECGHEERGDGQKHKARCTQCGVEAGAYDRR